MQFVHSKIEEKEVMIFPSYHQWDVVKKLLHAAKTERHRAKILDSTQDSSTPEKLAKALENAQSIIIVTIQTFSFALEIICFFYDLHNTKKPC